MAIFHPTRSATRPAAAPRKRASTSSEWLALGWAAAAILVVGVAAVIHFANQRGEEIARERAELAEKAAAGRLVQSFVASKTVLAMKDGSRRELVGATATLLSMKPIVGERLTWLALGRAADGTYFGQRFGESSKGDVGPVTDAQEISPEVALGELRSQISASGAGEAAAQAFIQAATRGTAVPIRR